MERTNNNNIWLFIGRFALVYALIYIVIAFIFLNLQNALPPSSRVALDFFEPYRLGLADAGLQLLLGAVLGAILYPFYDLIVKGERGMLILFAALWGVALLGNLEPKPGSIEGMIYTQTTFLEHILVLTVGAVQILLFSLIFLRWQKGAVGAQIDRPAKSAVGTGYQDSEAGAEKPAKGLRGYSIRFTLVHLVIYLVVGIFFYQAAGYEEALATMEAFELWRPLESLGMVAAVFLGQIARGAILALLLYPFYSTYMRKKQGWLLLFGLLLGLKVLTAMFVIPESLSLMVAEIMVGVPEIIVQTLVFALVFFTWEKRISRKKSQKAAA